MEEAAERQAEADERAGTWWTAEMPEDLHDSWSQLRGNAWQFVVTTPVLVLFAYVFGRGFSPAPAAGSLVASVALTLFAACAGGLAAAELLRRRSMPGPGVPGEVAGLRERRASAAYARATFTGIIAGQVPTFIGFVLVFMGMRFEYYLAFVTLTAIELVLAFPTRRRWERIMRRALAPS